MVLYSCFYSFDIILFRFPSKIWDVSRRNAISGEKLRNSKHVGLYRHNLEFGKHKLRSDPKSANMIIQHDSKLPKAKGGPPSPSPQLEETPAHPPSYYCVAKCQHVPALLTGDVQGRIFGFMWPWLLFCRARRFQLMYELLIELQSHIPTTHILLIVCSICLFHVACHVFHPQRLKLK